MRQFKLDLKLLFAAFAICVMPTSLLFAQGSRLQGPLLIPQDDDRYRYQDRDQQNDFNRGNLPNEYGDRYRGDFDDGRFGPEPRLRPGAGQQSPWQLGVKLHYFQYGAKLLSVVPGSAAAQAGLEAEDVIVTVEDQRIGFVGKRLIELNDQFPRYVDEFGRVTLMVYDHRTRRLKDISVNLGAIQLGQMSGTLVSATPFGIPRRSQAVIKLIQRSPWGDRDTIMVRQEYDDPRRFPINWILKYDPNKLMRRASYTLYAALTYRDNVLVETTVPVDPFQGSIGNMQLILTAPGQGGGGLVAPPGIGFPGIGIPGIGVPGVGIPGGGQGLQPGQVVSHWYQDYLGREPNRLELFAWERHIEKGGSLDDVQTTLLAGREYFSRAKNDRDQFIKNLFEDVANDRPSARDLRVYGNMYDSYRGDRSQVVADFLKNEVRR